MEEEKRELYGLEEVAMVGISWAGGWKVPGNEVIRVRCHILILPMIQGLTV